MGVLHSFLELLTAVECKFKRKVIEKNTMLTNEYFVNFILKVDCQHHYVRIPTNDRERLPPVGVSGH